ncbi:MAG: hypothetical protein L3J62_04895, partial [Gammaproteobacteria bacterium]|nr:hypothetical protein [Gammaproteobacteria bacterium]MCF6230123.1 hypothetical protein [Gammaproteobacteria bacterium]
SHLGPFIRSFSLNMPNIRLKRSKKWTQNGFPSLRSPKSDSLLASQGVVQTVKSLAEYFQ